MMKKERKEIDKNRQRKRRILYATKNLIICRLYFLTLTRHHFRLSTRLDIGQRGNIFWLHIRKFFIPSMVFYQENNTRELESNAWTNGFVYVASSIKMSQLTLDISSIWHFSIYSSFALSKTFWHSHFQSFIRARPFLLVSKVRHYHWLFISFIHPSFLLSHIHIFTFSHSFACNVWFLFGNCK